MEAGALARHSDTHGKPQVLVCGAVKDQVQQLRISDILISLSHCRAYATAYAVAERAAATNNGGKPGV